MSPDDVKWDPQGLAPAIVQDAASGEVLMLAWMNRESLRQTLETGLATFWSRSRGALWRKGETSGNAMRVREVRADCDRDALLMVVDPAGPACHTGTRTCFGDDTPTAAGIMGELGRVIAARASASPDSSYTARLLAKGPDHVLKKIGEEATEVVLAAKSESDERLAEEAADLLYHLTVAMAQRRVPFARALEVLRARRRAPR